MASPQNINSLLITRNHGRLGMEKTREDSWTEAAVTSTLQLSCSSGYHLSDVCGFGWQFRAHASSESISERYSRRNVYTYTRHTISLSFVPNFLRYASFNGLTLNVTCSAASTVSRFTLSLDDHAEQHSLSTYTTTTSPVTFTITVTFPKDSKLCLPRQLASPSQLILETISDSLTTGEEFIDTKFYLCSKRLVSQANSHDSAEIKIVAVDPRPLFANSKLLTRSSEYLNTLLCGPFGDSATANLDFDPYNGPAFTSEYDYVESDSDLEDDPDDEAHETSLHPEIADCSACGDTNVDVSFECVADLAPIKKKGSESSRQSTPEPRLFSAMPTAELTGPPSSAETVVEEEPPAQLEHSETAGPLALEPTAHAGRRIGRVVSLRNWAFRTWKALILYLYTDKIVFSSIGSQKHSTAPWSCSPKSMYRLAHEMQHETLKKLCLEEIRKQLTTKNIVYEVFSRFTSQYDEILDIETTFLCHNFGKITNFDEKTLQEIVEQGQIHSVKAVMTIIRKLSAGFTKPSIFGGFGRATTRAL